MQFLSETVLFQGWLEKKGSFVTNWKQRWMTLTPTALTYYTDDTLGTKKGEMAVNETTKVLTRDGSTHHYKFGIMTDERVLELSARTDEERLRWMDEIQDVIKYHISRKGTFNINDKQSGLGLFKKKTNMDEDTPMNRAYKSQLQKVHDPSSPTESESNRTAGSRPPRRLRTKQTRGPSDSNPDERSEDDIGLTDSTSSDLLNALGSSKSKGTTSQESGKIRSVSSPEQPVSEGKLADGWEEVE